jgi:uncharacterized tellurite resistance protein B-like protein
MQLSRDPYVAEQQVRALTFALVAFGFIDGELDATEESFIRDQLAIVAATRAQGRMDVTDALTEQYGALFEQYVAIVRAHFSESVADGESTVQFVTNKLKLGCFELLSHLELQLREALIATVELLMYADGRVHPNEAAFLKEVVALIHIEDDATVIDDELEDVAHGDVVIEAEKPLSTRMQNHPFFRAGEWDFSRDPATFATQSEADLSLVERTHETLSRLRDDGRGRLSGLASMHDIPRGPRVLDGGVYLQQPDPSKRYELLVLGDLHGCYSCMKAAILQADFFDKLRRYRDDPQNNPEIGMVLLGDYIDRGKFGYPGTLRASLQLFNQMPNEVVLLRGNHEYYLEINGRVVAPVRPCEAMDSLKTVDGTRLLKSYRNVFDTLPTSFLFGNVMFVHGGIPRDDTIDERWQGLVSLNEPEIAFEMLWSDPCDVDAVPRELQKEVARFGFGRRQFHRFMKMVGAKVMVRGHERIVEGFKCTYDDPEARLLTLFSAGGSMNEDLPRESNYREVVPMALTVTHEGGLTRIAPFRIDYTRYNDGKLNGFFADGLAASAREPGPSSGSAAGGA